SPGVIIQHGLWNGVDTREIVDKELADIVHVHGMIEFSSVEQGKSGTIQIDLIEMQVIRVFARFTAIGRKIEYPLLLVDTHDIFAMIGAARDLVLQFTAPVVKIEMRPAIALAPFDKLTALVHKTKTAYFHIGIEAFFDQGPGDGIPYRCLAHVDAFQVTTGSGKIEFGVG